MGKSTISMVIFNSYVKLPEDHLRPSTFLPAFPYFLPTLWADANPPEFSAQVVSFRDSRDCVTHIAFSSDSSHLALAHADRSLCLYRSLGSGAAVTWWRGQFLRKISSNRLMWKSIINQLTLQVLDYDSLRTVLSAAPFFVLT